MSARLFFISDFHKKYSDPESIRNYVNVQYKIQEELIAFITENDVTHVLIAGDWYDRGFHGLAHAYGSTELDRRLSAAVNGNVYLCIGNHFYLERDENPEMYIIQPNEFFKPTEHIPMPSKPIFQAVHQLNIGTVQIDFFHYNKLNKDYVAQRHDKTTFHIGLYHDEAVVPGWVREMEGFSGSSSQSYMNKIYDNIDLALHGHIHTAIGMCTTTLNSGRKVPLCIPGALSITQNKESYKHKEVKLPIIDIDDDSNVKLKMATFNTHLSELEFHTPKRKKKRKVSNVQQGVTPNVSVSTPSPVLQSLTLYLSSKGYGEKRLELVNLAMSNSLDTITTIRALSEVKTTNE